MQEDLRNQQHIVSYLVELTGGLETGELFLNNGEVNAKIYMNRGRIIWAFATGQEESFQSILLRENKISKEELVAGINQSRNAGKRNLDDILQALGIENPDKRRSIIYRHTKAALQIIAQWGHCAAQMQKRNEIPDDSIPGFELKELIPVDVEQLQKAETNGIVFQQEPMVTEPPPAPTPPEPVVEPPRVTDSQLLQPQAAPAAAPVENKPIIPIPPPSASEPKVNDIFEVLQKLKQEIPNFLAAMVIEGNTGMPIASVSEVNDLDIEVASAFYRDLMKSSMDALDALGKSIPGEEGVKEILITEANDYVLLRALSDSSNLLYVLIDSDSNPGMARVVIRRYLNQLNSFLA